MKLFFIFCFFISVVLLIVSAVTAIVLSKKRKKRAMLNMRAYNNRMLIKPFHFFVLGFFAAAFAALLPFWFAGGVKNETKFSKVISGILFTFYKVFRLISANEEYGGIRDVQGFSFLNTIWGNTYCCYTALLFVIGPLLAMGFILSFFKELTANFKYGFFNCNKNFYIFSELNERSLAIAEDVIQINLTEKSKKGEKAKSKTQRSKNSSVIVFANVNDKDDNADFDIISYAESLGCICMKKEITRLSLKNKSGKERKLYFISDNQDKNLNQALSFAWLKDIQKYNCFNTQLYVFGTSVKSEAILNSVDFGDIKVRRINENYNFAYKTISKLANGEFDLFKDLKIDFENFERCLKGDNTLKEFNFIIVGMGAYGTELVKALCWFGQMPGCFFNIHVFDKESGTQERLKAIAPELVLWNNTSESEQPKYNIIFHEGIDVHTYTFQQEIEKIKGVSMAIVALGEDDINVETAMKLRMLFEREIIVIGQKDDEGNSTKTPPILAVVFDGEKSTSVEVGLHNYKGNSYDITFIGSIKDVYSIENIEQNQLEIEGFQFHKNYEIQTLSDKDKVLGIEENKEYKNEYNRRSSIARAIYCRLRDKIKGNISEERLKENEHIRWMAYMRGEGYILGGVTDHIAKTHTDIVPYSQISESDKEKDGSLKK